MIQETWTLLEKDLPHVNSGLVARRVRPESKLDLHVAVERPSNERILIMRLHSADPPRAADLPTSAGLEVRRVATAEGVSALHVVLTDKRYVEIFSHLVDDVVAHIAGIEDEPVALASLVTRLRRWQAFLRSGGGEGLGVHAQLALFTELWVLREHLLPLLGAHAAVRSWTGPGATAQDFQITRVALEVKATSGKAHEKLHIASERQLDETGLDHLLLVHVGVDARAGHGLTLPDLVASIRELAQGAGIEHELDARLIEAGYIEAHADKYQRTGYAVRRTTFFRVGPGFPRLVSTNLPPGVGDVTYSIHVSDCMPFKIDDSEVAGLIPGPSEASDVN